MRPVLHRTVQVIQRPATRSTAAFLGWRAVSAVLTLAQLGVIAALFPVAAAATFFVLWTIVWAGSVWLRFGVDQVIPRHVALARLSGDLTGVGVTRRAAVWTAPALAAALPVLIVALTPLGAGDAVLAAVLCLAAALAWAVIVILGALLRGFDAVGRSGAVQGVVPAAALLLAALVAPVAGHGWLALLLASTLALWVALAGGLALTAHAIGGDAIRSALFGRGPADGEQVPAGLLSVLSEVGLALPMILGAALGASDAEIGGLYAATRVAAIFSWTAGAVAAVATPRLAMAIARRGDVGALLRRATIAAAASSLPLAAIGLAFPSRVLGLMSHEYAPYGTALVILVAGRLVDACTGPLSEALIVGRLVRRELANLTVFVATVVIGCVALEPAYGINGLAAAVALGTVACSLPRIAQVRHALRTVWSTDPAAQPAARSRRAPELRMDHRAVRALAVVAGCAVLDLAIAGGVLDGATGIGPLLAVIATILVTFAVAIAEARRRAGGSWQAVVVSPLAAAIVSWGALYGWRPLSLWLWPHDSSLALAALGFGGGDLVRAAAIGAMGSAAWVIGYLGLLGRPRPAGLPLVLPAQRTQRRELSIGLVLLGLGCLLWGVLFVRQGGFAVLSSAPGELHNDGLSSGYAVLGVWIVQGVALRGLIGVLRGGGRNAAWMLALGTAASLMAAVAMQARGLLFLGVVAAGVIVLCLRTPSRRAVAVTCAVAVAAIPVATFAQQVRSYSQNESPRQAVQLALKTPPGTFMISDLSVFDNLVALQQLVPGSVPRLDGSTLTAVPLAFVPRALWPGKPLPVDQQVSAILYPGSTAGSPVGLQGELMWNFGLGGVVLGAALVGALMGLLARARQRIRGPGTLALYAVAIASVVAPLTRALAPMTTNTAMALLGVGLVAAALSPRAARASAALLASARAMVDSTPARPSTGMRRLGAIDGLRALAALAVVVTHVPLAAPDLLTLANTWAAAGQAALMVFFAISGYILYRPFLAARAGGLPEPSLGQFLVRRLTRIVPAYWLLLTILAALGGADGAFSEHWWRYYLFAQVYTQDVSIVTGGIVPAWSLCAEITFYLLLAALVVVMRRRWRATAGAAARWRGEILAPLLLMPIGFGCWAAALSEPSLVVLTRTLLGTINWFAVGLLLAVLSVRAENGRDVPQPLRFLRDRPAASWLGASACVIAIASIHLFPTKEHPVLDAPVLRAALAIHLALLAAFLLVAPVMLGTRSDGRAVRALRSRPLVWLGTISFGTYLAHQQLLFWLVPVLAGIDAPWQKGLIMFAIAYPVAVAIGALSWYAVERPAIRAVSRALRRSRPDRPPINRDDAVRSPA
jgi:peptidoglycan/LPS O-acetylase OafA/YrhL